MVTGPFQPTAEELAQAERLGIDHSKMTCSVLRQRLSAVRSKSRPQEELREATIERLHGLGLLVNRQNTTSALLRQLQERLEYLLPRRGVIEGATLIISEGGKHGLTPGEYQIRSVTSKQTNRLRVFTFEDEEFDAYELISALDAGVTVH